MRGAGGGRPSKPEGQKINHHRPTHDAVVLTPREGEPPECPVELTISRLAWWDSLWRSPEASMWDPVADVASVARLVVLQTSEMTLADSKLLAECRQLEDRFGLNPYARRLMKWTVEAADDGESEQPEPKPRARKLKAV